MAAPLPTSYNPLTLKIAFASDPREVSKDEAGPKVTAARRAVGHLYGLSPEEVDALALWCWDDEGHAHGLTEDMMVSASTLATRCGTFLRLICVPGVSAGRTVKLSGEVGAQQVVQQPLARDLENGPRSSVDGPIKQQVATPPVEAAAVLEERRAEEVAAAPAEAIKAEAKEKKPEGQGEGQAGDAESTASGAGGSEAADGEGEGGAAGGATEQSGAGTAEGARAGGEASAAEAPPATTHEPLNSGEVLGHDVGHENSEIEARQAHRMDVTVFSPEAPHHVQDVTATEAEARASMRMD